LPGQQTPLSAMHCKVYDEFRNPIDFSHCFMKLAIRLRAWRTSMRTALWLPLIR
jgi:hypothetical protein